MLTCCVGRVTEQAMLCELLGERAAEEMYEALLKKNPGPNLPLPSSPACPPPLPPWPPFLLAAPPHLSLSPREHYRAPSRLQTPSD